MSRPYRLVTKNFVGGAREFTYSVMREGTKAECEETAIGRWGHIPPFAVITQRTKDFHKCF